MISSQTLSLAQQTGLRETPLQQLQENGIVVLYSELPQASLGAGEQAKEDALQFHATVQKIFNQTAVVPFRFPTLLQDLQELRRFLTKHGGRYVEELEKLEGKVELKVEVSAAAIEMQPVMSGTEFLRAKYNATQAMEQFAGAIKAEAEDLHCEWKQRERSGGLMLFCLVEKDQWQELRRRVLRVCSVEKVPARVTGPWPPSDFIQQYPELG